MPTTQKPRAFALVWSGHRSRMWPLCGGVPGVPLSPPTLLRGLHPDLARGASLRLPCPAGVMARMPSPSCAMLGRGAFWGEGEAFWGEGEASELGCVLLTPQRLPRTGGLSWMYLGTTGARGHIYGPRLFCPGGDTVTRDTQPWLLIPRDRCFFLHRVPVTSLVSQAYLGSLGTALARVLLPYKTCVNVFTVLDTWVASRSGI